MTVAVVTGAASGMGLACARRVRNAVDHLVLSDVRDDVESIARELGAVPVQCDVSDPGAVQRLADIASERGPLRSLVHAAGISPTMNDWRAMVRVDLVGTALVIDAFTPIVRSGTAAVCFASSAAHQIPDDPA